MRPSGKNARFCQAFVATALVTRNESKQPLQSGSPSKTSYFSNLKIALERENLRSEVQVVLAQSKFSRQCTVEVQSGSAELSSIWRRKLNLSHRRAKGAECDNQRLGSAMKRVALVNTSWSRNL